MTQTHTTHDTPLTLQSDLAGERPIYLYLSADKKTLLYSQNIFELLEDERVEKPLNISYEAISFLLQSGVVPPPKTAYQNVYILGIGYTLQVKTVNEQLELEFNYEFPFLNANRLSDGQMTPDLDHILDLVAEATINRIDPSKETFLFHSAGKDSNTIALALAKAGWQDRVTLISHKSKGDKDESEISKSIADKLGFKHKILHEVDELQDEHKKAIDEYFVNAPFPCTDNVSLAYPLYAHQMPELRGANVMDGGMNDRYMCAPPSSRNLKVIPISKYTQSLSFLRGFTHSENMLTPLLRTPIEWCGMSGLSFGDTMMILPNADNVYKYWKNESDKRKDWDIFDFTTEGATPISTEMFQRKARNFTDSIGANMILPFATEKVAKYFSSMPESYLFDRKTLKNKLILRQLLKERLNLDSDQLGKLGFTYDSRAIVLNNWQMITQEINNCTLWNQKGIQNLCRRLRKKMDGKGWGAGASGRLIYRLYLLSAWYNKNKYLSL